MLLPWAILLGVVVLVAGLCGTGWIALTGMFLNAFDTIDRSLDSGYFLALAGLVLLVPGSLVLVVTESRWRDATRPAPVIVPGTGRPKSYRRGLLLETFIPGTGAAYAGRSSMGLGWSLGTFIGGLLLCLAVFISINALDGLADNATENGLSLFPAAAVVLVLGVLAGSWLAARLWVVRSWLRGYNQSLAAPAPVPPPIARRPAFDAGRAISSTASALGLSVFVLMIGSLLFINPPLNPLQMLAELIPLAFWLALVHLRQPSSSLSAFGKVLAWIAVMALAIVLAGLTLDAVLIPGFTTSYLHLANLSPRTLLLASLYAYVLPVLLATGTGFSTALFFADWREVRRRVGGPAPRPQRTLLYGILPLLGIIAFLPLAVVHRRLVVDVYATNPNLFLLLYVLIPLIGCLWIGGVAALISWVAVEAPSNPGTVTGKLRRE